MIASDGFIENGKPTQSFAIDYGAVAVGECGLDRKTGDHEAQERLSRLRDRPSHA